MSTVTAQRYAAVAGVVVLFGLLASGVFTTKKTRFVELQSPVIVNKTAETLHRERVTELPEDAGLWHTVLVYESDPPADPGSRRLKAMFATTPRLQSLLAQTKVYEYSPEDPLYHARYANHMGGTMPQVWLLAGQGKVIYKASGDNIPRDGEMLADEIAKAIDECPWPRPKPPKPPTPPKPDPTPVAPVIPDIRPSEEPEPDDATFPLVGGILLVLGAAGAGLYVEWQRSK
jgi:hypothetical protein